MPKKSVVRQKLSRQQLRDLDVEISFMEGVVRRDPQYVEALQILGDDYTKRGKFPEGLSVDEQLAKLRPDDSLVHYNLACSYALVKQFERATDALELALLLGYRDFKWLAKDPDLAELRKHTAYKRIRARVKELRSKKRS